MPALGINRSINKGINKGINREGISKGQKLLVLIVKSKKYKRRIEVLE